MKRFLIFIIICLIIPSQGYSKGDKEINQFSYDSYKEVILFTLDKSLLAKDYQYGADPGGLILLLGDIDNGYARNILIQLLNIYIGSANSEALFYAITKQGEKIKKQLELLLSNPISCLVLNNDNYQYEKLKCLNKHERDTSIRWLLELIEAEQITGYVL